VQQSSDNGRTWADADLADVTVGQFNVEAAANHLDPANTYVFRVSQLNEFGSSYYSPASNGVVPLMPPIPSPIPTPTPIPANSKISQTVSVAIPRTVKARHSKSLPRYTNAGTPIRWKVGSPRVCKIRGGRLQAGKRVGVCRITGNAAGSITTLPLTVSFKVRIR
jgi:hypothetical protein